jgi:hypothetical protein
MLEKIASNVYYEIGVDVSRNRIYLIIKGYWQTKELVPNYVTDVGRAAGKVKPGFTVLADLSQMKQPADDVGALHQQAQKLLLEKGLSRTAEVLDNASLQKVTDEYATRSKMVKRVFPSTEKAEVWLNGAEK